MHFTATTAGTVTLTLKPTTAATTILKKKGKVSVTVRITFTPIGGTAASKTTGITFKKAKAKHKKQ